MGPRDSAGFQLKIKTEGNCHQEVDDRGYLLLTTHLPKAPKELCERLDLSHTCTEEESLDSIGVT